MSSSLFFNLSLLYDEVIFTKYYIDIYNDKYYIEYVTLNVRDYSMDELYKNYPHISFKRKWTLKDDTLYELGQCNGIITALHDTPISPEYRKRLLSVSLLKGAQATTAIEGNTLSYDEIEIIQGGKNLPPSKEYQEIEVKNVLDAFNYLLNETTGKNTSNIISVELIKTFHKMVGKNLGEHFQAIPGNFRNNNVIVGDYKPPDYKFVEKLIRHFCEWSIEYFHYDKGQNFMESVIQAIVSHIYIAWIHPFSDGNGRTARLLEFYILLRAGNPDFASHLLSNYYNLTRPEYYRHLDKSRKTGDISDFISYAVKGYRDGLLHVLSIVQNNQFEIAWKNFIHETLQIKKTRGKSENLNKRRRDLMLHIPIGQKLALDEIVSLNVNIAIIYNQLSKRTLMRDIKELIDLELLLFDNNTYYANIDLLKKNISHRKNKR